MDDYELVTWNARRDPVRGSGGIVGAKSPIAARIGAEVLANGGNAIDAAVATAFAIGVCEPWMNGVGGGGFMTVWLEAEQRALVISFPMTSASACTPDMFRLVPTSEEIGLLFGWPGVEGSANIVGPSSICVPGTVAGLTLALERYGSMPLRDVMAPAIDIATQGFPLTWQHTLTIAKSHDRFVDIPETAATFLTPKGAPKSTTLQTSPTFIVQPDLADTLNAIADGGSDAFYRGDIASTLARWLEDNGSLINADDFASYQAREQSPLTVRYHGADVHLVGGASGGTSLGQSLVMANLSRRRAPLQRTADEWHMLDRVFRQAFVDRFAYLGDPDQVDVPIEALLSESYARECVDRLTADVPRAGDRIRLGITHDLATSLPDYASGGSTTHLGVIDRDGNAVSLTQTLLEVFGSGVTVPGTGVLMNNGMMWFDPEPGRPNSIGGNKQPLANMAPAIVRGLDGMTASVGASGGRKIMNCNAQIIMNLVDHEMSAQDALDAPRIDCSTPLLAISSRIDSDVREALATMGHDVSPRNETLMTGDFSSPVALRRLPDGSVDGGADTWMYSATCVAR